MKSISIKIGEGKFFLGPISLWRLVIPYPEKVLNLPRTHEKLYIVKEENHIDLVIQTDTQTDIMLLLYRDKNYPVLHSRVQGQMAPVSQH